MQLVWMKYYTYKHVWPRKPLAHPKKRFLSLDIKIWAVYQVGKYLTRVQCKKHTTAPIRSPSNFLSVIQSLDDYKVFSTFCPLTTLYWQRTVFFWYFLRNDSYKVLSGLDLHWHISPVVRKLRCLSQQFVAYMDLINLRFKLANQSIRI